MTDDYTPNDYYYIGELKARSFSSCKAFKLQKMTQKATTVILCYTKNFDRPPYPVCYMYITSMETTSWKNFTIGFTTPRSILNGV